MYLDKVPGAISGQGGQNHTYHLVNVLMHGFLLGANEVLGLLKDWNTRCVPPWSSHELNHKVEEAMKNVHKYEHRLGNMLEEKEQITVKTPLAKVKLVLNKKSEDLSEDVASSVAYPNPLEDGCRQLLLAAFQEGEGIAISEACFNDEKRAIPAGQGLVLSREEWLAKLDAKDGDPNKIWFSEGNPGAFIRVNPMKVGGSGDNDVTAFRHALLEFDGISLDEQWKIIVESRIPATAVVHSGNKSLHAWVLIEAKDRIEYASRVTELLAAFEGYGPDGKNKNPSRFARLAGMRRAETTQSLLAVKIGAKSWTEWKSQQSGTGTQEYRIKDLLAFDVTNDPNSMLGRRWLCKGHACMIVGASGIGKSTLTMQLAVQWAAGLAPFGVRPVKPLKMLIIQAENDIGDLAEQFRGAAASSIVPKTPETAKLLQENIIFVRDTVHTGRDFVDRLQTLIDLHKPDCVWIDPLLSYIGDDVGDQKVASTFLRNWLGPLLEATGVILFVVHHIRKPAQNDARTSTELQYLAAGSSELVNWARAVIYLESPADGQFKLRFLKRGSRAGAVDHEGNSSESIWVCRGDEGFQTWIACPPPPEPEKSDKEATAPSSKFKLKKPTGKPWNENEYLEHHVCGRWLSYQQMINEICAKYGLHQDVAKLYWTKLKTRLSVKTPEESGQTFKTYTFIP